MSLCTKCNYKVDDKVWCLHFNNPLTFAEHAKDVLAKDKCRLYKEKKNMVYVFDRYRNGVLMASGVKINNAKSLDEAKDIAMSLFPSDEHNKFELKEIKGSAKC